MKRKPSSSKTDAIEVVGADANNLKFVDLELPRNGITAIVGASGSGKSSLLADTLAAEGVRRRAAFLGIPTDDDYQEVRAWIGPMPPTLHVGQRPFRASARTTVATATGLLPRIRRLFVRYATPWADPPGSPVPEPDATGWGEWLVRHWKGHIVVWAVPVRFDATSAERAVARLRAEGVSELVLRSETDRPAVWEKGRSMSVDKFRPLDPDVRHIVEARIGEADTSKKAGSVVALLERALRAGGGKVVIELPGSGDPAVQGPFGPRLDTEIHRLHPGNSAVFLSPSVHLLSFNAPEHELSGACPECRGTGRAMVLREEALVVDPKRSMHAGAFSLWTEKNYRYVNIQHDTIEGLRGIDGFDPDKPWRALPEKARRLVLDGSPTPVQERDVRTHRAYGPARVFEGFRRAIIRRSTDGAAATAARLAHLVHEGPCDQCGGSRWNAAARALRVGGLNLDDILSTDFADLPDLLSKVPKRESPREVGAMLRGIAEVAQNLTAVGLGHLTGSRGMLDVSSGEARRIRLAGVLDTSLEDLFVLLDEPARGLHDEDIDTLAVAIRRMSTKHTVVVSDHRAGLMRAVDHVIDMGTIGGPEGGYVRASGPPSRAHSLNATGLSRRTRSGPPSSWVIVRDVRLHSLQGVEVRLPLGRLSCITGVSGSGKSTFARGALVPGVAALLPASALDIEDFDIRTGAHYTIDCVRKALRGLVALDQRTPPMNRRSLVATFLGLGDDLRHAFAATPEAKKLGLGPNDFGVNSGRGRCETCLGLGVVEDAGHAVGCPRCGGLRYGPAVLAVSAEGRTIDVVLNTPLAELSSSPPTFLAHRRRLLEAVSDLGLGYVALGRRVDTLSGGEVQRLRIARALGGDVEGGTMFVLDEPAAGLHPGDVARLLGGIERMLDDGRNTVVLVEHNSALIGASDHVVEFGPGGGPHGGRVVAHGTPGQIARTKTATGRVLAATALRSTAQLPRPAATTTAKEATNAEPARALNEFRRILGEDIAVDSASDESSPLRLVISSTDRAFASAALWEIGGLSHEIATFVLEANRVHDPQSTRDALVEAWSAHPDAVLAIRPFLPEVQVWGGRVPASSRVPVLKNLAALGLRVHGDRDVEDALSIVASGGRLVPPDRSAAAVQRAIENALALGSGYVELIDRRSHVLHSLAMRPLDLDRGLVGPLRPAVAHLLRSERVGRCPMCEGCGRVLILDASLLIARQSASPLDEKWLTADALALLRSIRRSELVPLLQRVTKEGLAPLDMPFSKLPQLQRDWLLHGLWLRPGPGTFLKPGRDPSEVGSWLRWDGLYRVVNGELDRAKNLAWKRRLEESKEWSACPRCGGSGLGPSSEILFLGARSLQTHVNEGTPTTLAEAVRAAPRLLGSAAGRHERRRKRLLEILDSLRRTDARLRDASAEDPALAAWACSSVAQAFTTLPIRSAP